MHRWLLKVVFVLGWFIREMNRHNTKISIFFRIDIRSSNAEHTKPIPLKLHALFFKIKSSGMIKSLMLFFLDLCTSFYVQYVAQCSMFRVRCWMLNVQSSPSSYYGSKANNILGGKKNAAKLIISFSSPLSQKKTFWKWCRGKWQYHREQMTSFFCIS